MPPKYIEAQIAIVPGLDGEMHLAFMPTEIPDPPAKPLRLNEMAKKGYEFVQIVFIPAEVTIALAIFKVNPSPLIAIGDV